MPPLYEYECPECHEVQEHYIGYTIGNDEPVITCDCIKARDAGHLAIMKRIMSAPCPPRMGGIDGKLSTGKKIKARNDAHFKSASGQEEFRHQVATAHRKAGIIP